jgi:hypothetical protein
MRTNWRIGSLLGIPLYIDSSWFLILAFVTLINATDAEIQSLAGQSFGLAWLLGLIIALLLFISVLLHELGHSFMARFKASRSIPLPCFSLGVWPDRARISDSSRGLASSDRWTPRQFSAVLSLIPCQSLTLFKRQFNLYMRAFSDN